jgi:hypothetical protein
VRNPSVSSLLPQMVVTVGGIRRGILERLTRVRCYEKMFPNHRAAHMHT